MKQIVGVIISSITQTILGRIKGRTMAGSVEYKYEPIDPSAIADYLNNDFYNPPPQGGIPLPPRRPVELTSFAGMPYTYTPEEQAEVNNAYQAQDWRQSVLNTMYPTAMRARLGSYFGNEDEINQHHFSPSELNALREDYLQKKANYMGGFDTNPLTGFKGVYEPIPDVSRFIPYEEFSKNNAMPDMQGWGSMFSGTAPFSRGAYYEQSPEGIRLKNLYVTPYSERDVNVLLPLEPMK